MVRSGGQTDAPLLRLLRQETQQAEKEPDLSLVLRGIGRGVGKDTAHFDAKGRLLTHCAVCGKAGAGWGFGVFLGRERLGTWYCGEHRPHD